jgi:hypothetical protein
MKRLQEILDGEEVPEDAPHWIVEMHAEFDERDMTPLQAVKSATGQAFQGHCWLVTHVRSGLTWSVDLGREEVIEIVEKKTGD